MSEIKQIHDKFFQKIFSDINNVKTFLKASLPDAIGKQIDYGKIKLDTTSYISDKYKGYYSDIVVKTIIKQGNNTTNKKVDIYILFEHKSYKDKKIFIQLLRYIYLMLEKDIEENKSPRVIIPIVFYHGEEKWDISKEFADNYEIEKDIKKYLLNFQYILFDTEEFDLEKEENKVIKENVKLLTAILLMKSAFNNDLEIVEEIIRFWKEKGIVKDKVAVIFFMNYILGTKEMSEERFKKITEEIKEVDIMPTLAQKWMDEGIKEGIKEGELIEVQNILIRAIDKKFKINDLEKQRIKSIKNKSKLDDAMDKIIFAENKEEVIRILR